MFRLLVWDQDKWEVTETIQTDHVSLPYRRKWGDPPFEMYLERDTVHAQYKWSRWCPHLQSWLEIAELDTPSMVRMTAMLLR